MDVSRIAIGLGLLFIVLTSWSFTNLNVFLILTVSLTVREYAIIVMEKWVVYPIKPIILLGGYVYGGLFLFITTLGPLNGKKLLLHIILTVSLSDTLQYILGSTFGKKLEVGPSPNKSIQGYMGAILAGFLYYFLFKEIGLYRIFVWIVGGIFGDLYVSSCKRSLDIKDTSCALGGHGGFIDRLDSTFGALVLHTLM